MSVATVSSVCDFLRWVGVGASRAGEPRHGRLPRDISDGRAERGLGKEPRHCHGLLMGGAEVGELLIGVVAVVNATLPGLVLTAFGRSPVVRAA